MTYRANFIPKLLDTRFIIYQQPNTFPIDRWDILFAMKNDLVIVYLWKISKSNLEEIQCSMASKWLQCSKCDSTDEYPEEEEEEEEEEEDQVYDYNPEPGNRQVSENYKKPTPIWFKNISRCIPTKSTIARIESNLQNLQIKITGVSLIFKDYYRNRFI